MDYPAWQLFQIVAERDTSQSLIWLSFLVASTWLGGFLWWRIFKKTGHTGPTGLWMLVPIANIIAVFFLAFSEWPIEREIQRLKVRREERV